MLKTLPLYLSAAALLSLLALVLAGSQPSGQAPAQPAPP